MAATGYINNSNNIAAPQGGTIKNNSGSITIALGALIDNENVTGAGSAGGYIYTYAGGTTTNDGTVDNGGNGGGGGTISTADGSSTCGVGTFGGSGNVTDVGGGGVINNVCPP